VQRKGRIPINLSCQKWRTAPTRGRWIDLETVCSGTDILELERGSAAFPHLLEPYGAQTSGIPGHKLDMSGKYFPVPRSVHRRFAKR